MTPELVTDNKQQQIFYLNTCMEGTTFACKNRRNKLYLQFLPKKAVVCVCHVTAARGAEAWDLVDANHLQH